MPITPSPEQLAIFQWARESSGNLIVSACAGGGKTCTCLETLKVLPVRNPETFLPPAIVMLSFSKPIADTLAARCPSHVSCSTFHSLGLRALKNLLPENVTRKKDFVDAKKVSKLVYSLLHADDPDLQAVIKLVDLAKQQLDPTGQSEFCNLADRFDIDLCDVEKATRIAVNVFERSNADLSHVDFSDMLYLPVLLNAPFAKQDWVFVDEAQDTNDIQLEILERLAKPFRVAGLPSEQVRDDNYKLVTTAPLSPTRFLFVGDPHQAIYAFRGANSDSMTRIKSRFSCSELPLSVSYRCPQSVVAEAQKVLALQF